MRSVHLSFLLLLLLLGCRSTMVSSDCSEGGAINRLKCVGAWLPACPSSLHPRPRSPAPTRKDSDEYRQPSSAVTAALEASVRGAFDGNGTEVLRYGKEAGYSVCRDAPGHLRWTPGTSVPGGAAWLINPDPSALPIILEAPHSYFDKWTLDVAAELQERLGAQALLVSGTHRCASRATNQCSGKIIRGELRRNQTCEDRKGPHRISDPAHDVNGTFHAAHRALSVALAEAVVVSVHGMPKPGVSLSNGTINEVGLDSPVARLARAFRTQFPDQKVTVCNPHEGSEFANRMCGTGNVQGRHLNGSPNPCTVATTTASDRFIHLELSKTMRKQPAVVANALRSGLAPAP